MGYGVDAWNGNGDRQLLLARVCGCAKEIRIVRVLLTHISDVIQTGTSGEARGSEGSEPYRAAGAMQAWMTRALHDIHGHRATQGQGKKAATEQHSAHQGKLSTTGFEGLPCTRRAITTCGERQATG